MGGTGKIEKIFKIFKKNTCKNQADAYNDKLNRYLIFSSYNVLVLVRQFRFL